MFSEFFRFELKQQLRTPFLWLGALVFAAMAFGATCSDAVQIGGSIGNVTRNAPVVIVQFLLVFSIIGMLVLASTIAGALLRDFEQRTAELVFSTPMRKAHYLFGRFGAALTAALVVFAAIALGMVLGTRMPWLDPERLGPFSLQPYLWALAVVVLPNLVLLGALLALLSVTTRSMLTVYLGLLGFLTLWIVAGTFTRDIQNEWIASLLDPFCARAFGRTIRYWSAAERNTLLPPLGGFILANRAFWAAVALGLLGAAYAFFAPQTGAGRMRRLRRSDVAPRARGPQSDPLPGARTSFGRAATLRQLVQQVRFDVLSVLTGVPFLVMLVFGVLNLIGNAASVNDMFGTKVYPVTYLMLDAMRGGYNFLLVLVATFYAGELVWKERAARVAEVTDALPVPSFVPLAAKLAALVVVVVGFMLVGIVTGMGFQLFKGYSQLEPGLYLRGALLDAVPFVLLGALALVLQVVTNNKFAGYLALILVLVAQLVLGTLHFEHNLYNLAGAPTVTYSDMNGFGPALRGHVWFLFYWLLFTALAVVVAALFWVRGIAPAWRARVAAARARFRGPLAGATCLLAVAFSGTGAWIFYNTNVLNRYVPADLAMDRQAFYEKSYRRYLDLPQPRITDVKADVDIYPDEDRIRIRGRYRLLNRSGQAIPELHVLFSDPAVNIERLSFAPAELRHEDRENGYRIYRLEEPMPPSASMDFDFDLTVAYRGFTNDGAPPPVRANGTFFTSAQFFPAFGYQEGNQLVDRAERRKRGLGPVPRMPRLEDEAARRNTFLSRDADWIHFETTVSTSADQIAISPGYLLEERKENGRRVFRYAMDAPMLPFFAYLSARWQVRRDAWNGIPIEVYHDARHTQNVERMIVAVKKSLDYFSSQLGPYQHRQVRILEFPRYATFAQSFANTIPYSESIGFVADLRDQERIDYVFYVTAHEMAHQWWAHQVIGANVQGAQMLSESLAQYSALMVMEKEYGREKMRRFLKYELDGYLRQRGGERVEELPLLRVENQPYICYQKGSLVLYRLREEIGEARLNRVLARFVAEKAFQQPPYTTSRELLDLLHAETTADEHRLLRDLFEGIVFYDDRVTAASARKRADGRYEVTVEYEAGKLQADGKGVETPLALDDWMEVGVFGRASGESEAQERVLHLERRRITEPRGTFRFLVAETPYEAGLDPYNKLIDRVSADNRRRVSLR